jgi:hypothetical protein
MFYDDYFNQNGKYLGTDNDPNSNKVRIMDNATWEANKSGDGTINHKTGVANSSLHSGSGISNDASMKIYGHYNDTGYEVSPNEKGVIQKEAYLMQFQAAVSMGAVLSKRIRVHVENMNRSGRADDFNDIKNLFVHENNHGQLLKDIGAELYMRASSSRIGTQFAEKRAIEAQMSHPTWNSGTQGLRDGVHGYANRLGILIHGLNIPSYKDHISPSAPLKIKK